MSMCAPEVEPCCASYMEALTRTSSSDLRRRRGNGVADGEINRKPSMGITPPAPVLLDTPVLLMTRHDGTWLVLLPLKRLLASTPFNEKLLLVSRWPLAQMGALPRPELAPVPPESSALTPGDRMATPVKLPVASGTAVDLRGVQDVAVGGVDGIHQRRGFHFDGGRCLADLERGVHRRGAIGLHGDVLGLLNIESLQRCTSVCRSRWEGSRMCRFQTRSSWWCA